MSPEPLKHLWDIARSHNEPPDNLYGLLFDIFLNPDNLKGIKCDEIGRVIHPTTNKPQDFLIGTLNTIDQKTGVPTADRFGYVRFDLTKNEAQFTYRIEDENRPGYYAIAYHQLFFVDNQIRSLSALYPFQAPQGANSFLRVTDDFLLPESEFRQDGLKQCPRDTVIEVPDVMDLLVGFSDGFVPYWASDMDILQAMM